LQLAAALLLGSVLWFWKRRPTSTTTLLASLFALCATCALFAAQRSTPPPNDIAQLVRSQSTNFAHDVAKIVSGRHTFGWIADHPQRGDFGIEYPLQCDHVTSTRNGAD
jgi:hypothetical protein